MAILPHPTNIQPTGIPILDRGHPLGAHLIAGWIMNNNDYPMELIRQRRATDGSGTGPAFFQSSSGGSISAWSVAEGSTVFTLNENKHLDNTAVMAHSVVARASMIDATDGGAAAGWLIQNNSSWGLGQITDKLNYRCYGKRDVSTAAGTFVNGRVYTLGASNNLTTVYLYVNGIQKTSGSGDINGAGDNWQIGDLTGHGERWAGNIEYVYVFDKVLTPADHMWIHQNPYGIFMQPALSRWFEFSSDIPTVMTIGTSLAKVTAAINVQEPYITNSPRLNAYFEHFWGGRS